MRNDLLDFRSDNVGAVSPEILRGLVEANAGTDASYGDDAVSKRLDRRFTELFETPVTVFPVATGTAANALALSACARPYGGIYCHGDAHIETSEGGATEQCGWLRDRYGVSWQIVPTALGEMMKDPDREKAGRCARAMMSMVKLDIAGLRKAFEGG